MWMISKCRGGDFVVLRTDDDDLYNKVDAMLVVFINPCFKYIFKLGHLNSVASLCVFNRSAAYTSFVIEKLANADCLFFAGGDQWTYYQNVAPPTC